MYCGSPISGLLDLLTLGTGNSLIGISLLEILNPTACTIQNFFPSWKSSLASVVEQQQVVQMVLAKIIDFADTPLPCAIAVIHDMSGTVFTKASATIQQTATADIT